MSFGGFNAAVPGGSSGGGGGCYDGGGDTDTLMTSTTAITQSFISNSMFTSPSLSLALQTNLDGFSVGDMNPTEGNFETNVRRRRRSRDEETATAGAAVESRSGSDNIEGCGSGDDQETATDDNPARKKKRYHRHTPQQIQELEAMFKECPHPDEKQRLDLSRKLSLETRQVKFWFQNRRTQMKTQLERHENNLLRQENDKLRAENMSIRETIRNPICPNCGGPAIMPEISLEEQQLRIENVRLKDELDRVCAVAGKFSSVADFGNSGIISSNLLLGSPMIGAGPQMPSGAGDLRSMYVEIALNAMDELVKMAESDEPLWVKNNLRRRDILNKDEYLKMFRGCCFGAKPNGFVTEASRDTGIVIINSLALVEILMDSNRWAEMFPGMIARAATTDVISGGMGGTRNGSLQLMHAELQVLSPMVPVRELNFLRFCKQHADGIWAVVDVSVDTVTEASTSPPTTTMTPLCRRLPSGCLVHDMPNGYSKVVWVEHNEYDESHVHQLYRRLLSSGVGFGARRWITTLQRQCECLAVLISLPSRDHTAMTVSGRRSMVKLAQRMTANFCAGVCASTMYKWNKLNTTAGNVGDDVRVMTRKSVDDPGEPPGTVLSAATSVWLPVSPEKLFDFLRDERLRSEWDILSNGGPMQEMIHIPKGQDPRNSVSLLRAAQFLNSKQSSMLILQETCTDASGSLVVYAPVDIPAMQTVMNGGDSAYVALLPSGFAIAPAEESDSVAAEEEGGGNQCLEVAGGSLLTVAFQILVNSLPTDKLTVESVETVKNLISCTVQKIRGSVVQCEI